MKTVLQKIVAFINDEDGAVGVEYALLVGLIAIAVLAAAQVLGLEIGKAFGRIQGVLAKNTTDY